MAALCRFFVVVEDHWALRLPLRCTTYSSCPCAVWRDERISSTRPNGRCPSATTARWTVCEGWAKDAATSNRQLLGECWLAGDSDAVDIDGQHHGRLSVSGVDRCVFVDGGDGNCQRFRASRLGYQKAYIQRAMIRGIAMKMSHKLVEKRLAI